MAVGLAALLDDVAALAKLAVASVDDVGTAARRAGVTVLELAAETGSLEDAYLQLTGDSVEYRTADTVGGAR